MKYFTQRPLSLTLQKLKLQQVYPKLIDKIFIYKNSLYCEMRLQPSENSCIYKVKIKYKLRERPKVWMIEPQVKKFNGEYPIHKYGFDEAGHIELCVYCPYLDKWDEVHMFLAEVFVPWVATWLRTYECWLATGIWFYDEEHPKKLR